MKDFWYRVNDFLQWLTNNSIVNQKNDRESVLVDTRSIESSHSEVIDEAKTNHVLISPASGNRIVVRGVFLLADDDIGPVSVDFEDGDAIARMYTSQFKKISLTNMTLEGGENEDVRITGGQSDKELFVIINYIEEEVEE